MRTTEASLELAMDLIRRPSVTPSDAGCQEVLAARLSAAGFGCESMQFGDVTNLWARYGEQAPLLCLAGHTDVVPPGDADAWHSDPFVPDVRDGYLYGRGAADMKGGLAAMIVAAERFVADRPVFPGSIAFLITSDEEGSAINGTRRVMRELSARGESIDYCIVGEPSSDRIPGDVTRIGRRGSLTGRLSIGGVQGHVAYAHLAKSPIRAFSPALSELITKTWDEGNAQFPPTTFELTHLHSSSGADNVIPASLDASFNFRYSTEWDEAGLRNAVEQVLQSYHLDYVLNWHLSGTPFVTQPGKLTESVRQAILDIVKLDTKFSTGGGTSDGRFIAPTGADVVEVGLCNATIHQVNERTSVEHLSMLQRIYESMIGNLLD